MERPEQIQRILPAIGSRDPTFLPTEQDSRGWSIVRIGELATLFHKRFGAIIDQVGKLGQKTRLRSGAFKIQSRQSLSNIGSAAIADMPSV